MSRSLGILPIIAFLLVLSLQFKATAVTAKAYSYTNTPDLNITVFPNPYEETAQLSFELEKSSQVSIAIYDVIGNKKCSILENKILSSGQHVFVCPDLAAGVYLVRILVENEVYTQRLIKSR